MIGGHARMRVGQRARPSVSRLVGSGLPVFEDRGADTAGHSSRQDGGESVPPPPHMASPQIVWLFSPPGQ